MIITETNKQTNKQANNRNRLCDKQNCKCIALIQGNEKKLIKFATVSSKMLKTVKCLANVLFSKDAIGLYYVSFLLSAFSLKDNWKVLQKYLCLK